MIIYIKYINSVAFKHFDNLIIWKYFSEILNNVVTFIID